MEDNHVLAALCWLVFVLLVVFGLTVVVQPVLAGIGPLADVLAH